MKKETLRDLRLQNKKTAEQVATELNIARSTYSNYEQGILRDKKGPYRWELYRAEQRKIRDKKDKPLRICKQGEMERRAWREHREYLYRRSEYR